MVTILFQNYTCAAIFWLPITHIKTEYYNVFVEYPQYYCLTYKWQKKCTSTIWLL